MVIGLPPVLNFGSAEMKAKVVPEVFAGKKFISLAISEAFAGSDVTGIRYACNLRRFSIVFFSDRLCSNLRSTTAVKSEDGKYWTINGSKK